MGTPGGEDALVGRIAQVFGSASGTPPDGDVWIGDDAAVVGSSEGRLVLATDAAVEGVHADLLLVGLDDLGWKALSATLSDIGAMGGRPSHALVTFCVPPGTDLELLAAGTAEAAARWACPVVGGDVTGSAQVVVSVAAIGVLDGPAPAVLRSGASAGDTVFVTGPLGASAAGLRLLRDGSGEAPGARALVEAHRRPQARVAEGICARSAGATAMMDVSDGLGLDLHRMADASGVGVMLERVPVAEGATEDEAISGGEDFELLIATSDAVGLVASFAAAGLRRPIEIGRCSAAPGRVECGGRPVPRSGYEHELD